MSIAGAVDMLADIRWNESMVSIVGAFAIPVTYIIASHWYRLGRARSENALKREMVARGMSAEEIERVMATDKKDE